MTEEIKSNVSGLELYSDIHPFRLSLRITNFENEATYKKFIKNCELLVRRCNEYNLWRNYIIDILQINECMITHESIDQVTIDVHHHIPSLYTLVASLINKKLDEEQSFCSFDIAQEAIELHFKNRIGYVTLLKSMHEKFHNGHLTIPISFVKGNYKHYLENFSRYLDEPDLDKIQSRLAINESNVSWSRDDYPASEAL
ncbi:MAG: hypothetical protein ACFFG0_01585 [Candidatus Thorarchaeota archaeon]